MAELNATPHSNESPRPLMLIEVLVAEYEQHRQAAPPPQSAALAVEPRDDLGDLQAFTTEAVRARCDAIWNRCREIADGEEREKAIGEMQNGMLTAFYRALHRQAKAHPETRRAALCFSGGGIRSATFVLGLLQGLTRRGVQLNRFQYVSTVSGGGYIGSWLSAWIHREGMDRVQTALRESALDIEQTSARLARESRDPITPLDPEPEPVQHLRRYSNYMSPRLGLLSADTWTLVGIFLRNLSLNWLVLLPLLMTGLAIPRIAMSIAEWNQPRRWAEQTAIALACGLGILCIAYMIGNLPSKREYSRFPARLKDEAGFQRWCWLPLVASAFLSAAFWAWIHIPETRPAATLFGWPQDGPLPFVAFGLLFQLGGYAVAHILWVRKNDWVDLIVRALTGALGGICLWAATLAFPVPVQISAVAQISHEAMRQAGLYVCFGPPLFLLMFLVAATVFIGLNSGNTNDADREWMARAGAWMLIAIFGWSALSALAIFGPMGLLWAWQKFYYWLLSVSAGTGLLTLLGGFSARTSANKKKDDAGGVAGALASSLPLVAGVFTALVLSALSLATSGLVKIAYNSVHAPKGFLHATIESLVTAVPALNHWAATPFPASVSAWPQLPDFSAQNPWWHLEVLYHAPTALVLGIVGLLLAIGLLMGFFVNINKFSLHSAYRDRLIRAYLGASHNMAARRPNPFTGFDDQDNLQMHELLTARFRPESLRDLPGICAQLAQAPDEPTQYLARHLGSRTRALLHAAHPASEAELTQALVNDLNRILQSERLHEQPAFAARAQALPAVAELLRRQPWVPLFPFRWLEGTFRKQVFVEKLRINRLLIEDVFREKIEPGDAFEKEPRPLHVLNIALNLVAGKELAWQERKAQPFTVSPLHAGSYGLGYRAAKEYAVSRQSHGALSLGTSLAISGAAVSPNMGYNSSPLVTFLLTLFNVRLGWWLGNPGEAGARTFTKPSPFFAPKPLIAETLGQTDSEHSYVYLSDGAHFENLALYEMVRRRCHAIILSDAGADPEFDFGDLGNALRKIRIDLGIPIVFAPIKIRARESAESIFARKEEKVEQDRHYCAIARICYSAVDPDAVDGTLLYLKPTVYGLEPPDVLTYAKANPTFPHESTGDQMYSESQFESYRALGFHAIETLATGAGLRPDHMLLSLDDLLDSARKYLDQDERTLPAVR